MNNAVLNQVVFRVSVITSALSALFSVDLNTEILGWSPLVRLSKLAIIGSRSCLGF